MGISARGDFDLQNHWKHSGQNMMYQDDTDKRQYVPHVIEPSVGLDRCVCACS